MKARVKATFTFDVYVNGEYSNELSFISGDAMTLKQAVTLAKKKLHYLSASHAQIFLAAGSLAVADVTMFNREITVNDYNTTPAETYAVCWGDEYKEEDGENNAIATTTSESDAKEIAESESETNNCTMSVIRKSDRKVIAIYNNTPETPNPENTPTTMNANETKSANISHAAKLFNRIDAMNERGAWNKGVKVYALTLLNWYIDEASESPLTLDAMLNGANDWYHYSRSGCGVAQCYNARIAETLCSPSELKRCKGGAKNPNSCEDWCDVEGRALVQAWQLINTAEMLVSANM